MTFRKSISIERVHRRSNRKVLLSPLLRLLQPSELHSQLHDFVHQMEAVRTLGMTAGICVVALPSWFCVDLLVAAELHVDPTLEADKEYSKASQMKIFQIED